MLHGPPSPPSASLTQTRGTQSLLSPPLTCCPRFLLTQRPVRFRSAAELCGRKERKGVEQQTRSPLACALMTMFEHCHVSDAAGVAGEKVVVTSVKSLPALNVHASGETTNKYKSRVCGGELYRETLSHKGKEVRVLHKESISSQVDFYVSAIPLHRPWPACMEMHMKVT